MLDYDLIVGLTGAVVILLIVAGVILLFPISRKLGRLLEAQISARENAAGLGPDEARRLRAELAVLESKLDTVLERQEFLERLVGEASASKALKS